MKRRFCACSRNQTLLLAGEIEFNNFGSFLRAGLEFPFFERSFSRLNEQRAAADGVSALDMAIGFDNRLNFDFSGDVHLPRNRRVVRHYSMIDFSLGARALR